MELNLSARSIQINPSSGNRVDVILDTYHEEEALEHYSLEKVMDYFDKDKMLDAIGVDYVKEYFGLIEDTEEQQIQNLKS